MMSNEQPKLSVCIPSYNRSGVLRELLDSILKQNYSDYEIVICEDNSPQRDSIGSIVKEYALVESKIKYFENSVNLGFDNNIKELLRRANGEYCVFMGNDDIMAEGALDTISSSLSRHPDSGVFLRTYASFDGTPDNIDQVFRYATEETYLPSGIEALRFFFRRSVVIPGVTMHRESALSYETDQFDGSLLYQIYLVGMILSEKGGVYSPEIVTLYRNGGIPDFGNAKSEKGKFVPQARTPESSLHFIDSMVKIASHVSGRYGQGAFSAVFKDMTYYSYPFLSVQADKSKLTYTKYGLSLSKLGFYKSAIYWVYFTGIFLLGTRGCDRVIRLIKNAMGRTPQLGLTTSKVAE